MREDPSTQFWYNVKTGEVEHGFRSPSVNRVGPFATREEAANAPQKLRENSERWAREDEEESAE